MKLNKDTRNEVKIGTILRQDNDYYYQVTNIIEVHHGNGRLITVRTKDGLNIYGDKLSDYYGLEIDNSNDNALLYDTVYEILTDKVRDAICEVQGNTTNINPWYEYHFDRKTEELARLITEAITEARTENYGNDPE